MYRLFIFFILFLNLLNAEQFDKDIFNKGEKIYLDTCVSCHGIDGRANTDMKLIVRPRDLTKTILTEEQTYFIVKDGAHYWGAKSNIMPAFKYVYDEAQLKAVSYYISQKFHPNNKQRVEKIYRQMDNIPNEKLSKMLKRGKKIYKRNCVYCHGNNGEGDGIATKNPEDSIFPYNLKMTLLTQEQIFLYAKYGGQYWGTYKDDMPSWKVKYDDFTLRSVAKYIDEVIKTH